MGRYKYFQGKRQRLNFKNFKLTNGGLDFCIESAGKISTIELGFSLLNKEKGHLLFASHPPEGEKISISPHELISGKKFLDLGAELQNQT